MNFLRQHWFDLGIALAAVVGGYALIAHLTGIALLIWINLITPIEFDPDLIRTDVEKINPLDKIYAPLMHHS